MAIKDWKVIAKGGKGNLNFINWGKKFPSTDALRLEKNYHSDEKMRRWRVIVGERYGDSGTITGVRILKSGFKTKSKALAYARSYMRKH